MQIAAPGNDLKRPVYGSPERRVYGQAMGMLSIESQAQIRLLLRVVEVGMRDFAGKHEETFLQKMRKDLQDMGERAVRENWAGWDESMDTEAGQGDVVAAVGIHGR